MECLGNFNWVVSKQQGFWVLWSPSKLIVAFETSGYNLMKQHGLTITWPPTLNISTALMKLKYFDQYYLFESHGEEAFHSSIYWKKPWLENLVADFNGSVLWIIRIVDDVGCKPKQKLWHIHEDFPRVVQELFKTVPATTCCNSLRIHRLK